MIRRLAEMSWTEVDALDPESTVALLPVGAVEAHGPHLPLITDLLIAEAMADAAAAQVEEDGLQPLHLLPLTYAPAPFAAGFPGTVSISAESLSSTIIRIAGALVGRVACLGVANAHLDPAHLAALHASAEAVGKALPVAFPDLTRRQLAVRLGEEFQSGASHAGRFETSIVMAVRPEMVRERTRRALPAVEVSLSKAIRAGKRSFEEIGLEQAYCGAPAAATAAEGKERIATLGAILAETVVNLLQR